MYRTVTFKGSQLRKRYHLKIIKDSRETKRGRNPSEKWGYGRNEEGSGMKKIIQKLE